MDAVADEQAGEVAFLADDRLEQRRFESESLMLTGNDSVAFYWKAKLVLLLQLLHQLLGLLQMLALPSPLPHFNFPLSRRCLVPYVLGDGAHGGLQGELLGLDDQFPLLLFLVLLLLEHEASLRGFQRRSKILLHFGVNTKRGELRQQLQ